MAIETVEQFDEWLRGQPQEVHIEIASRAALRVFPATLAAVTDTGQFALETSRAILSSVVSCKSRDQETIAAAINAARSSNAPHNSVSALPAGDSARFSARIAFAKDWDLSAEISSNSVLSATISAGFFNSSAKYLVQKATFLDTEFPELDRFRNWLWPSGIRVGAFENDWNNFYVGPGQTPEWAFWREWYEGFMNGEPLDWELQREIALLPDDDWDKGAAHIAGLIEEIRARFALKARIAELEGALASVTVDRHAIGGNQPPEPIADIAEVAQAVTVVWATMDDLKAEVESDTPSKPRIERILAALGRSLKAIVAWCGRKADLTVDTIIKLGLTATAAKLVAKPEVLEAVITAAKNWLPFLH